MDGRELLISFRKKNSFVSSEKRCYLKFIRIIYLVKKEERERVVKNEISGF
jgi:hypothetical protein